MPDPESYLDSPSATLQSPHGVDPRLGIQLWSERDDSPERVEELISRAAEIGFGQVRIFLMWPWIQPEGADVWDFALWDSVFDAAQRHGIKIKATLTANSGPWWLGTPSVLHSHTLTLDQALARTSECLHRGVREAVCRAPRSRAMDPVERTQQPLRTGHRFRPSPPGQAGLGRRARGQIQG